MPRLPRKLIVIIMIAIFYPFYAHSSDTYLNSLYFGPAWLEYNWGRYSQVDWYSSRAAYSLVAQSGPGFYLGYTRNVTPRWALHTGIMIAGFDVRSSSRYDMKYPPFYSYGSSKNQMQIGSLNCILQYQVIRKDKYEIYLGAGGNIMMARKSERRIGTYQNRKRFFLLQPTNIPSKGWVVQGGVRWHCSRNADLFAELQYIRNGVNMNLFNSWVIPGHASGWYKIGHQRMNLNPTMLVVGMRCRW